MRDALYWRYYYKFQALLARDVNYLEMIKTTEASMGNGVRAESSLPFSLITRAHHLAYLQINGGSYPVERMNYEDSCHWTTLTNHPWILEVREREEMKLISETCTKEAYHYWLEMMEAKLRVYVDDEVVADNYYIAKQKGVVVGGFATTKRGYLTGVFTLKKGIGRDLFKLRMTVARLDTDKSVKQFRIFCTGDFLLEFYKEMGFKVTDVVEWEDKFAPKGWNYEEKGRPNLYNLERSTRLLG